MVGTAESGSELDSELIETNSGRVLLVEDEKVSLLVATKLLRSNGYEVIPAVDGESALVEARRSEPDVILLDLMLPGISGFDVCRELKNDEATAHIPILVQTNLAERENRLEAIGAGANDYIHKPIDPEDMLPRLKNAVHSKRLYDRVRRNLHQIQEMERLKENLMHMIIHDMRNPLNGIAGWIELARDMAADRLTEKENRFLASASTQSRSLQNLIDSLLDISRLEHNQMPLNPEACELVQIAREAVDRCEGISVKVNLALDISSDPTCECDPDIIRRVLVNIISNAIHEFSDTDRAGEVNIGFEKHPDFVRTRISDNGPGIPDNLADRIFDKFTHGRETSRSRTASTGLGLNFCKLAIEAHGGAIGCESTGNGATFWFDLPVERHELEGRPEGI